jgi:CheY-like chemotaxis protein
MSAAKRIMLIEDIPEIRRTVDTMLSERGYELIHASDTREAIDCLRQERESRPCLILVDPFAHGVTLAALAEMLREDDHLVILPVGMSGTRESGEAPPVNIAERSLASRQVVVDAVRGHCPLGAGDDT